MEKTKRKMENKQVDTNRAVEQTGRHKLKQWNTDIEETNNKHTHR